MQKFKVSELIPHPQNEFFFDDMEGQKWKEFLESVRTSGIIEPPVVTAEGVIVSGHQRIRACKELGIEETFCEVRKYDDEDKVVKDLIETNIRQRGTIAGSDMKMSRILNELERIYGIRNGRPSKLPQVAEVKSQEQLAQENGMSVDKWNRLKKLAELPDEYQEMLESGRISTNTAVNLISKLSDTEQQDLLKVLPATEKITKKIADEYIDQIKGLEREKQELQKEAVDAVRAAKSNEDGEEYLRMKDKLEEVQEERRKYYEKWREATGKPTGVSESDVKRMVDDAKESVKAQYQKLTETLQKKVNELEDREPEFVEVEVIPDEYKQAKEKLDAIEKASKNDTSKRIKYTIPDNRTHEDLVAGFGQRLVNEIGSFLSIVRGLEVEFNYCSELDSVTKSLVRKNAEMIQQILSKMDKAIMEGDTKCKTA